MIETLTTFTFFLRNGEIEEIPAPDPETALQTLARNHGKSRVWMLEEILECLSPLTP